MSELTKIIKEILWDLTITRIGLLYIITNLIRYLEKSQFMFSGLLSIEFYM